ncbi:MAG: rhomboid family intramembrane serine protease [Acidimicrobiaceae bacterium]|nr:rhomboid family intramembrane serine protease [Acidimicrobiaceae bacterium]
MSLPPPPPPAAAEACYRHPDREAGRRCTRCGRPACSDCLVQASVGSHCVECAKAAQPDVRTRAQFWNARQPALVTSILIGINLAVFAMMVIQDPQALTGALTRIHLEFALYEPALAQGEWYRLVTSGFLHYGIIHVGFNMYLLYIVGQMLEPAIGRAKFLLVYLAGLLGGSAGAVVLSPDALTAGASGAVFGLLALAFVGYWLNGTNPMSTSIGSLLILNLVLTFLWSNRISVGGHLGGAIAGALCALVVMAPSYRKLPVWAGYAAPIGVISLSVLIAVLSVGAA